MNETVITKALEIWTLQNLLNLAISLGILATGLAMLQSYYDSLEKRLSLRVSIELWRIFTVLLVDLLLAFAVLIGYLVINPDIMSDVKMAVPFFPAATILWAIGAGAAAVPRRSRDRLEEPSAVALPDACGLPGEHPRLHVRDGGSQP